MVRLKESISFTLFFSCEWLFCFLVLLPIMPGQWAMLFPFIALAIIHSLLLSVLQRSRHSSLAGFLFVAVIIGLLAWLVLHMSLFASALLSALLTYFSLQDDEGRSPERLWRLMLLFAVVVVAYTLFAPISRRGALFLLLFVELAAAGMWISFKSELNKRWLSIIAASFAAAAILLALITSFLKPVVTVIYNFLFNVIIRPITYGTVSVIFGWLNHFSSKQTGRRIQNALQGSNIEKKPSVNTPPPDLHPVFNFGLIFGIIIAAALLLIVFWQLRKIKRNSATQDKLNTKLTQKKITNLVHEPSQSRRPLFSPKNPVRRAIYKLQKRATKQKLGRRSSESLAEWLRRLKLTHSDILISSYEKVRYGGVELTDMENKTFFRAIDEAKQQLNSMKQSVDSENKK
ncbi:MAG: DUF4129 domain-containing protein [Sporolactobacillus sp.]